MNDEPSENVAAIAATNEMAVLPKADPGSMTMRDFLETFGTDLMHKAAAIYPPLLEIAEPVLPLGIKRLPKGGQTGALAALRVGLEVNRQTFLVAEPGSGKTITLLRGGASGYSLTLIPKQTLLHNRNLTVLSTTLMLHVPRNHHLASMSTHC